MNATPSRRDFIGQTILAGSAAVTGTAHAKTKKKKASPTVELLKVGVVAAGDNSHMNYSIWAPTINPTEPDMWYGRTTRMLITHVWDSRPDVADAFAKKYKCETVKNYYDMVDQVDGMIFAGFNEVKWWPQLTKPYLEAGIPCFINRPFAYSMKDAKEIVETARKYNTPILCTDEREFIKEAIVGRAKVEELIKQGKKILGANSDNSAGYEYPQHGVHGLYYLLAIFGLDVERVSLIANGWWREKTVSAPTPMQWGLLTLQYGGIELPDGTRQEKPFVVSQQQLTGYGSNANVRIYYDGGWWDMDNYWENGDRMNRLYCLFFPTVLAMQRMFETREMPWSYDYILSKTRIFLAGFKSHLEHNGGLVQVSDLPDDWEAPCPYPDWIDESIFR